MSTTRCNEIYITSTIQYCAENLGYLLHTDLGLNYADSLFGTLWGILTATVCGHASPFPRGKIRFVNAAASGPAALECIAGHYVANLHNSST